MNVTAKIGWWGGALLLAVCTRQIVFGVLPLAVHWHRRQMAQVSHIIDCKLRQADSHLGAQMRQMIDQKFPPVEQLLTQVQSIQTRLDQQTNNNSPSIRKHTTPLIQAIHHLQQRLHHLELETAPQVGDLTTQFDQLQNQVNHLAQGVALRQGVGVFIDGANLHASARKVGVDLDYATLLPRLLAKDTPATIHFYSGFDPANWQQRCFHRDLEQMGMQMHTKPVTYFANGAQKANLDGEMIVDMLTSSFAQIVLLSGDGDFLPALQWLALQGVQITVAAFAPDTHRPLQRQFPFRDLRKLCTNEGVVIPLPVKQTSSSVG